MDSINPTGRQLLLIPVCIFFLLINRAHAQISFKQENYLEREGKALLKYGNYKAALEIYTELDTLYPNTPEFVYNIGLCTFQIIDKPKSLFYFLKANDLGYPENIINYYLGRAYQFNGNFEKSVYYLKKYLSQISSGDESYSRERKRIENLIYQINSSGSILDQKLSVEIVNMGPIVNSDAADYVPIVLAEDNLLVFTSRRMTSTGGKIARDGFHFEDVYVSKKDSLGKWDVPKHFSGLNSNQHDANVALNPSGDVLYVYKARHGGDIYSTTRNHKNHWSALRPLKGINTPYWEGSITLFNDEKTIFFSSDKPGGYGGSDIYSAEWSPEEREWINIQNLGPIINTAFDEDAPFIFKDGKTFFFSSKGHNSIGGYDIFSARLRDDGNWENVRNMGFPINTFDDDIYFHLNTEGSVGYFTSLRNSNYNEKSIGEKDLFQINRPNTSPVHFILKGKVFDEKSNEPIPAVITLQDVDNNNLPDQKLVADVNTGIFNCTLKFDNRYKLTVEVGDKAYYSKELYYPYQADLFETLINIPLDKIPAFELKLNDVVFDQEDESKKVVLTEMEKPTIILVRKVPPNDDDLQKLLLSDKIPYSFRVKIAKQLKQTPTFDQPKEGSLTADLFKELLDTLHNSEIPDINVSLEVKEKVTVATAIAENPDSNGNTPSTDNALKQQFSDVEKEIINRIAKASVKNGSITTFDRLYYANLTDKERAKINGLIATQAIKLNSKKSLNDVNKMLKELADSKDKLSVYDNEAWNVLSTIETTGFKRYERLTFRATLHHRNNKSKAEGEQVLLIDDEGLISDRATTGPDGKVIFANLLPGKRYHILVNDYLISTTGNSRFALTDASLLSDKKHFMTFYENLTPEQKRMADRISASMTLKEQYQLNPEQEFEDKTDYASLSSTEKQFIENLQRYLSARAREEDNFRLDKNYALKYDQLDPALREKYNRIVSRTALQYNNGNISLHLGDSSFYNTLTELEKGYIEELKNYRTAKKVILEDFMIKNDQSNYWYMLGSVNTKFERKVKVKITGRVLYKLNPQHSKVNVGLVDNLEQFTAVESSDSSGRFTFSFIDSNEIFNIGIQGDSIKNISDYTLVDVKVEYSEDNFYEQLTDTEKRRIDRIIAINIAKQNSLENGILTKREIKNYDLLTESERNLIKRLQAHLFADTVLQSNMSLSKNDHRNYYNNLNSSERELINFHIVKTYLDSIQNHNFDMLARDKAFYNKLTENQKNQVRQMEIKRRAAYDIMAENPVFNVVKRLTVLDSVSHYLLKENNYNTFALSGKIVNKNSEGPEANIAVTIVQGLNEVIGMVSTDSAGNFKFDHLEKDKDYLILVEERNIKLSDPVRYKLQDVSIDYYFDKSDSLVTVKIINEPLCHSIFYKLNESALNTQSKSSLLQWITNGGIFTNGVSIQIDGHADYIGGELYNQTLSFKRANAVYSFIISQGYNKELLMIKAYGETKPHYFGKDQDLNRRVELCVIK